MRSSTKKLLLLLLLVAITSGVAVPHVSRAVSGSCFAALSIISPALSALCLGDGVPQNPIASALSKLIHGLVDGINFLLSMLTAMMVVLIRWMIEFGTQIMSLPIVQNGFKVCLNLINLLFVMGLIISAFQIILGIDEGGAKSRIKNVIIAALLVNFSFLIAGFLLDISNVFTHYFLTHFTTADIAEAFSLKHLELIINPTGQDVDTFTQLFASLPLALFSIILTALVLIIMIAVFATALVRTLWVALLLTVMPLTWGMWIFPGLSKYTSKWWDHFIQQGVVVLPTITFFIFLTVSTSNLLKPTSTPLVNPTGPWNEMLKALLQMCILGGFLVGGLKISQAAGGITAGAARGAAAKVGGGIAKYTGAKRFGQFAAGGLSKGLTNMAGSNNLAARTLGKLGVLTGVAGGAATFAHGREHDLEEQAKTRYGSMDKEQLSKLAMTTTSETEKAKIMMMLAKQKGGIKELAGMSGGAAALTGLSNAYHNQTHKDASSLDGVKDAIKENPLELAQALGGDEYRKDPATGRSLTRGEAAVKYMKKNGIASGLQLSKAQLDANPEIIQAAIDDPKFLASLDSGAAITTLENIKKKVDVNGTIAVNLKTQYQLVQTSRQAFEDVKTIPNFPPAQLKQLKDARDQAVRDFKAATATGPGKVLRYLDQSIRSEP